MQQDPQAVVGEVPEAVAGAFHFLDEQVQALGGAVGSTGEVVVEDLGAPPLQGPSERSDLLNGVQAAALDRAVQKQTGLSGCR